ncbi:unnamed protein product [Rotaria sordida]|uniref:TIR domain-containing protein n=1 Tax=Rotaria sordida TaxID=392033 RepID=A0A813S0S1_9BILA|nr:unnamed protein product [Rotaria sordida]
MGTFYAIETINGRDVSQYSANPEEQEVILMPGTRIYLTSEPLQVNNGPFMLSFKECMSIPQGKHVMISHDVSDEAIILQVLQVLRDQSIPIWFDKDRKRSDNIYDSLAVGVENAAFICCFVSPDVLFELTEIFTNNRHERNEILN